MADEYDWEAAWNKPEPRADIIPLTPFTGDATAYGKKALQDELRTLANTTEGSRNHQLNASAFNLAQLVAAGHLDSVETQQQLRTTALTIGLTATETDNTLRSAFNAGTKTPRQVPDLQVNYHVEEVTADDLSAQKSFWQSRDILTHIQEFAYARMTSPWAVLGVCLLRMLALIPPHVVLPPLIGGYGSLNLFIALVGPSGSGKGAAERAAKNAIEHVNNPIYTAPVGSGEGIAHQYAHRATAAELREQLDTNGIIRDRDSVLFTVHEVNTLTALGQRQGSTLLSQLCQAFSGERLGFGYADATRRIPLEEHTYRLGMSVGVQPEKAGPIIYDEDSGTPQRFVWLPASDPNITATPPPAPPTWIIEQQPPWHMGPDGFYVLNIPDTVTQTILIEHAKKGRGEVSALDMHALFAREKVAQALAFLDQRRVMTEEDWELSEVIMRVSDITRTAITRTLDQQTHKADVSRATREATRAIQVAETVSEAAVKRVSTRLYKLLSEAREMPRSELRKRVAQRDREHFDEALERLAAAGQAVVEDTEHGQKVKVS